ncbi:MAG: hypothetical protein PHD76_03735 [Methylacidiphilales bacterium]|nr:hypothetical protein [Candidatus Methylacidiphilales bacterium]
MNIKRLILAIAAVFAVVFITDYFIHRVWLMPTYQATASLWRPQGQMCSHIGWLTLAQLLWSATFVVLWAKGFAEKACPVCAVLFGLFMGVFFETNSLISYAVQPLPCCLALKWIISGVGQSVLAALVAYLVYKPNPSTGEK